MGRKRKKKYNNKAITLLFFTIIVLVIVSIIGLNYFSKDVIKLRVMGYDSRAAKAILEDKTISDYVLSNKYDKDLNNYIKHSEFIFDNLNDYKEYAKNNKIDNETIIYMVNNGYKDYTYNDTLLNFMNGKYYLKTRLDRYLKYYEKNSNLSIDEVIKRVNSDIDYDFYTNTEDSDTSYGKLLICNKHYYLGSKFTPSLVAIGSNYLKAGTGGYLTSETYEAFKKLSDAAKKEGLYILSRSPYRSYATQNYLYNNYVKTDGKAEADTYSARPGYSEHQTGLALDVGTNTNTTLDSFQYTKEYTWMQNHAHEYGFIMRYPKGQEYITGYMYESWHYRYVGVEAATTIHNENLTFEEYFTYYVLKK